MRWPHSRVGVAMLASGACCWRRQRGEEDVLVCFASQGLQRPRTSCHGILAQVATGFSHKLPRDLWLTTRAEGRREHADFAGRDVQAAAGRVRAPNRRSQPPQ
eukprot:513059-Rhodomonas_salina.3